MAALTQHAVVQYFVEAFPGFDVRSRVPDVSDLLAMPAFIRFREASRDVHGDAVPPSNEALSSRATAEAALGRRSCAARAALFWTGTHRVSV